MKILATIKAALKKAGIPEKYAAKVQALFDIESEENLDNYIGLFKDNILPDLVSNEQGSQASIDAAIAAYEKKHGLKDGKPIETTKTKKTKKPKDDEEDEDEDEDLEGLPASVVKLLKAQQKQISELAASVSTVATTVTLLLRSRHLLKHCLQILNSLQNGLIVLMSILKLLLKTRLKSFKKNLPKSNNLLLMMRSPAVVTSLIPISPKNVPNRNG